MAVISGELSGRVSAEAERVQVGRILLTALAALWYVAGWVSARVFVAVAVAVRWSVAAVRVGWADGVAAGRRRGPAR